MIYNGTPYALFTLPVNSTTWVLFSGGKDNTCDLHIEGIMLFQYTAKLYPAG